MPDATYLNILQTIKNVFLIRQSHDDHLIYS